MTDLSEEIKNLEEVIKELNNISKDRIIDVSDEIKETKEKLFNLRKKAYENLTAWDKVEIARIFDRFYTVQYQHQGTGLGLYISKTIVESLGYRMSARFDEEIFEIKIDFSKKYSKE